MLPKLNVVFNQFLRRFFPRPVTDQESKQLEMIGFETMREAKQ